MDGGGLGNVILEVVLRSASNTRHGRNVDNGARVPFASGRREEWEEGGRREEVAGYMRINIKDHSLR